MKYTPEEIRAEALDTRLMDYDDTADMLEAMLKAVEAASVVVENNKVFLLDYKYNTKPPHEVIMLQHLADTLAPFDFTTEEEVKP